MYPDSGEIGRPSGFTSTIRSQEGWSSLHAVLTRDGGGERPSSSGNRQKLYLIVVKNDENIFSPIETAEVGLDPRPRSDVRYGEAANNPASSSHK